MQTRDIRAMEISKCRESTLTLLASQRLQGPACKLPMAVGGLAAHQSPARNGREWRLPRCPDNKKPPISSTGRDGTQNWRKQRTVRTERLPAPSSKALGFVGKNR
ncbi:hypothetical protein J3458_002084 [Metarhizium acridum]|uniref:uncharacterized protein n=1 Tax=Metarhizium acridum TaxID=92637 RepID=UPI001C6CEB24|nr:hypothetical protein J3458_002084 [Metarhizium acridum]